MARPLRFLALVLINAVIAVVGTAVVESSLYRFLPRANTISAVLWKESVTSFLVAGLLGLVIAQLWRTEAAKWTWILTSLLFMFGVVWTSQGTHVFGSVLPDSSLGPAEIRSFFSFTVPLIRGAAYSLGALVSLVLFAATSRVNSAES